MTALAELPYAERLALTAKARAIAAASFEKRLDAYRVLTRKQGLTRKTACRRIGIAEKTAVAYEARITGMTASERRAERQRRFAELRSQGLTPREAAAAMGLSADTGHRYEALTRSLVSA